MNLLNPFNKNLDNVEKFLAVFFDACIIGMATGITFLVEECIWENQTEVIYQKTDLIECIHSNLYYSTWRTSKGDTVAVHNEHNVHIHNCWCCHPISCEGTRVLVDSVPAIPTKIEKVKNSKSCTYHWERVRIWNW